MLSKLNPFAPYIGAPGLSMTVGSGVLNIGTTATVVPLTVVGLAANATSFVFLNLTSGAIQSNTSGFPTGVYPIATVTTNNVGVASLTDSRPDISSGFSTFTGGAAADAFNTTTRGDRQIILQNPDFEGSSLIPPPGWVANPILGSTFSYETSTQAPGKNQSLKIATTAQFGGIQQVSLFSATAGDTYSISGMAKADGSSNAFIVLVFQDKTGANIGQASASTTSTNWTSLTASATAPANAVSVRVLLNNQSVTQPSTVWYDQISIQKINFPVTAQWNGVGGTAIVNAFPQLVAKWDGTGLQANVGSSLLYSVPANAGGLYRVHAYVVNTQAATTSSTLPAVEIASFTDNDTSVAHATSTFTGTGIATNAVGDSSAANTAPANPGTIVINAKGGTNINILTTGYASTGATPMQYALHIKLEYLGI